MKCRVTVDIPDGEGWVEALGLGRDGRCSNSIPQMYCGVSRSICRTAPAQPSS